MKTTTVPSVWHVLSALPVAMTLAGCVTTEGAYRMFSEDLRQEVGHPFSHAIRFLNGWLKEQAPMEVAALQNGNELRTLFYGRTSGRWSSEIQPCTVAIEVSTTQQIVKANAQGQGCWRSY
jgi:hypothetical protein